MMKGKIKKNLKKSLNKIKKAKNHISPKKASIDNKIIYIECKQGKDFLGDILCITQELSKKNYEDFKIYVYARKEVKAKIEKLQENYNLRIEQIVTTRKRAINVMKTAKYVITDSVFVKRIVTSDNQTIIFLWDEIPLKTLGRDNFYREYRLAHIQQIILSSEYIVFPDEYTCEKALNAYMMEKIYPEKILIEEFPRNHLILNSERKEEILSKLNLNNKRIMAYISDNKGMWGAKHEIIEKTLRELDKNLTDDEVMFLKLHEYNQGKINFKDFKHIKTFPKEYDFYEILNTVDTLITTYTNLIFDFARKGKIILYNYGDETYLGEDESYIRFDDLPFPQAETAADLIKEIKTPKEYDDGEFIEKYCLQKGENSAEKLCKHIFKGEKVCREERIENDKPNILIYGGALLNNGITSSLVNLLNNIERERYNIFISFRQWEDYILENHHFIYEIMPNDVEFLPLRDKLLLSEKERILLDEFLDSEDNPTCPKSLEKVLNRELKRQYPKNLFQSVVNFDGYGIEQNLMFSRFDTKTSIWVHNDMLQEIETRDIQNKNVLKDCYNNYDSVALVSPDLIEPTSQISKRKDNMKIVHNINNHKDTLDKGAEEIFIDKKTEVITRNIAGIGGILESPGKKIITIGRFSPEKGHFRLLKAFDKLCDDYPDTKLIIIGGHGPLYYKTRDLVHDLKHKNNVLIIKWISNPMPILKECDLFILSSFYEGWPMVLMEADTFHIPVLVTDVTGTQWTRDYGGTIVENSEEGILNGLYDFMNGKEERLDIDFEEYNKNAVEEFYSVL